MSLALTLELVEWLLLTFSLYGCLYLVSRRRPGLQRSMQARRSVWLSLSILLMLGLQLSISALSHSTSGADLAWLQQIQQYGARWQRAFEWLTWGGSSLVLTPLTLLLCGWLYWRQHRREAGFLALAVAGGGLWILLIKALVGRERPLSDLSQWYWGSSFPSGHSLGAATFAGALALISARLWPRYRSLALLLSLLWMLLIGLSRLVLGVHWPSDVLVAFCLGLSWVLILELLLTHIPTHHPQ